MGTLAKYLVAFVFLLFSCGISKSVHNQPQLAGYNSVPPIAQKLSDTSFVSGHNFFLKNKQGLWELYTEGDPLERGMVNGSLTAPLLQRQEKIFFGKIAELVPSKRKQKLLRFVIKVYNRKLYRNVTEEYKTEIFGVSGYTTHDFDYVAPRYLRSLYLHAAHDIGHALQDLALVGCSSFAAWGDKTTDGGLLLGRKFDFYVCDEFAENKVVSFMKPKNGYPFMTVTWPGMIGAVSGMNNEGLTVTINAGKSKIPLVAKTPISLVTREILQYAKNIDEAIAIAKKRAVFVSESIMVGSAADHKAVILEVSPKKFGVYEVPNSNQLICSNHFQSSAYKTDARNQYQIANSHSRYRYQRMEQLIGATPKLDPPGAAAILRNKDGLNDLQLGYGNEKALNQLRAHHAVIFKPEKRLVWVSSNPYQLGEFVCYDLNKVFGADSNGTHGFSVQYGDLNIPKDTFADSPAYFAFQVYKTEDKKMDRFLKSENGLDTIFANNYIASNPDFWEVYYKLGKYYYGQKEYKQATKFFETALTKEITTVPDKQKTEKYLKKSKRKS